MVTTLLQIYKKIISPLLPGNTCRFYPSCSTYAIEAIHRYGTWQGVYLGMKRLLRCHPFHPGGYDPIP
ncbi:MAG TPA: membrane protein insertion efficiency factor YidD [Bacteroidota bacterium]|nr:membrane protein insertion efficiency factor YidD [Bacteroidota bacterium]